MCSFVSEFGLEFYIICRLKYILTKSVCSLFPFLSFLSSRRSSVAWMQAGVSLRRHSCVDGSCSHSLNARRSFLEPTINVTSFYFPFLFSLFYMDDGHMNSWTRIEIAKCKWCQHHGQLPGVPVIHWQLHYTHHMFVYGTFSIMTATVFAQ